MVEVEVPGGMLLLALLPGILQHVQLAHIDRRTIIQTRGWACNTTCEGAERGEPGPTNLRGIGLQPNDVIDRNSCYGGPRLARLTRKAEAGVEC